MENPYGDEFKVYGPYKRKDGRMHVCLYDGTTRITVSYPKYIIEMHLGRKLLPNETVDHIDRDFTNNKIENLRVIDRVPHIKDDARRVRTVIATCVYCKDTFLRRASVMQHSANMEKAGPFCSSECTGLYGATVQNDESKRLPAQPGKPISEREYFFRTKDV